MKFTNNTHRKMLILGAVAALSGSALIGPSVASAKTTKVSLKITGGKQVGTTITGKVSGSLGKGTAKGKLVVPDVFMVFKLKGGTLKVTQHTIKLADAVSGTLKFTGGTGKYQKAKGTGTYSGVQSKGTFNYTGKIKY